MHAQHVLARRLSSLQHSGRQNDAAGAPPPNLGVAGLEHDAAPVRPTIGRRLRDEKVARDSDPLAIDQETHDFATIFLGLDEFLRWSTIFLAAAGNADRVLEQPVIHSPFVDVRTHAACYREQKRKGRNAQTNHGDPNVRTAIGLASPQCH